MTFDYAAKAARVDAKIRKAGAPVTLTRVTPGAYDDSIGGPAAGTTATWTGGAGVRDEFEVKDIDGTRIQASDFKLYLSTVGIVAPRPGDQVLFAGATYSVIASKPLQPAITAVLWTAQLRGAA